MAPELLRLSFYSFTAASLAVVAATALYLMDVTWLGRVPRPAAAGALARWRVEPAPRTPSGQLASTAVIVATLFAGASVLTRAIATGHGPYADMYEFSVAFIFAALVGYVAIERVYRIRLIGAIALPVILGMVAYVWSLPPFVREDRGLVPALSDTAIMTAHVSVAVIAYASFALSFAAAVAYLVVTRWSLPWAPNPDLLDDIAFRAVTIGFPAQALLLIIGSFWAHRTWGAYWSWDPKETAALFTWLVYGAFLHTRALRGWRGERSAWFLVIAFSAVVFTYFGNYWFGGLHAYSGLKK